MPACVESVDCRMCRRRRKDRKRLRVAWPNAIAPERAAARGPQAAPSIDTARNSLSSAVASRRRERSALWQDSGFFQDSFFGAESRSDSGAASEFGSIGSILRGGVSMREVGTPPAGDDTPDRNDPRARH